MIDPMSSGKPSRSWHARAWCLSLVTLLAWAAGAVWPLAVAAQQPVFLQVLQNPVANTFGFGGAIAVDDDTLVVGAPGIAEAGTQRGAVSIFTKVQGSWVLQQSLTRSTGIAFGSSVAVDGDTLIAATQYYSPALDPGPLVFVRRNGTWTQQAELRPSNTGYRTGARVVLDGDTALVATVDGGVYAFVRSGEVWTQQQQLLAEHYAGNGIRLALEGDTALVGAPDENVGANRSQGAVFVYTRAGGVWTRRATLTATPGRASELFGFSLGFSDGTALVVGDEVYQFTRSGDTWIQQPSLPLPPAPILSFRPVSATIDGDTAIVLMNVDPRAPTYAYVYRRVAGRWLRLETPGNAMNYVIGGGTMFGGDGGQSGEGRVVVFAVPQRVPTGPPSAPLNVRATVSGNIVSLAWDAPYSGSLPSGYTLVGRATAGGPVLAAVPMGSGTSFSVTAPNGTFVVSVTASNDEGTGPESTAVTVTAPQAVVPLGPPVGLLSNVSGATVSFSWNPPSRGGPVTSYVLWAGLTPSVSPPLVTIPVGAATSYVVTDVPPGTYYVFVQARNAWSVSAASNVVTVHVAGERPPEAPTLNAPTVTGSTVTVSWSAGPGGTATTYTLTASLTPGGPAIATVPLTGTSASFTNVPSGHYYVRLTATNSAGTSPPSAQVTVVVP